LTAKNSHLRQLRGVWFLLPNLRDRWWGQDRCLFRHLCFYGLHRDRFLNMQLCSRLRMRDWLRSRELRLSFAGNDNFLRVRLPEQEQKAKQRE
jgi:hypothetical protein